MKKVLPALALAAILSPAIAMAQSSNGGMAPYGGPSRYQTMSGNNPGTCMSGDTSPACQQQAALPSGHSAPTYDGFYNLPNGGSDAKSTNAEISGGPTTDALSPSAGSGNY